MATLARPRVETGSVVPGVFRIADAMTQPVLQCRLVPDGPWHRPGSDGLTACGLSADAVALRIESFKGALCAECFTSHERARAHVTNGENK